LENRTDGRKRLASPILNLDNNAQKTKGASLGGARFAFYRVFEKLEF